MFGVAGRNGEHFTGPLTVTGGDDRCVDEVKTVLLAAGHHGVASLQGRFDTA